MSIKVDPYLHSRRPTLESNDEEEQRIFIQEIRERRKDCKCEQHPYANAPIDGEIGDAMCWKCQLKLPKDPQQPDNLSKQT